MEYSVAIVFADIEITSKDKAGKILKIGFHISHEPRRGLWIPSTVHQGAPRCDFCTIPDPHDTEHGTARKWVGTVARTYFHKHKPRAPAPVLLFSKMDFTFLCHSCEILTQLAEDQSFGAETFAYLERRLCSLVKWEVAWLLILIG